MKKLLVLCWFFSICGSLAADGVGAFQAGLLAFRENGADALLSAWYSSRDDGDRVAKIRERLVATTQHLGPVMEIEVFAPRNLGKNLQRLYGVIYFEKRPLWIRAEYYSVGGRSGFISLDFSLSADDILPLVYPTVRG